MMRTLLVGSLAAFALYFGGISMAVAQGVQQSAPAQIRLANTQWQGSEDLWEEGKLTFQFGPEGKVLMVDKSSSVNGTYTVNGTSIRIQFANCVYEGTIDDGSLMSGTAQFTSGRSAGQRWNWSVCKD